MGRAAGTGEHAKGMTAPTVRTMVLAAALLPGAALAVGPMPQSQNPPLLWYPCDPGAHPCNSCNAYSMAEALQVKRADRSARSTATPDPTYGVCSGTQHEWCQRSPALESPTYSFATNAAGQLTVRISVGYDFPNNYCQVWDTGPSCNASLWPLPPSQVTQLTRLILLEGANEIYNVPAVFENGTWIPTLLAPCDGSTHTYTLRATNSDYYGDCVPPTTVDVAIAVTFPPAIGPCGTRDRGTCPAGGNGAGPGSGVGLPINVGSGDVTTSLPLFTIDQPPLPLAFNLTYHSSPLSYATVTVPTPLGAGWTHPFNQVMKPIPGSSPQRLYHYAADGREFEYTQSGSVWNASRPAELRGTVTQDTTNHLYVLTDLDGTVTRFYDASGLAAGPAGAWLSTADRWGNTISGAYSAGNLVTLTDSAGRQISLAYTSGVLTAVSVPETPIRTWSFSYNTGNTLLFGIRDPVPAHASTDWRSLGYDGGGRLASIQDDASKLLEGHTYDGLGRGFTSYSEGNTRNLVQVDYDTPITGQTTVTHRIDATTSQVSVFSLIYQGGRWLPTRIDGPCATCGGASGDTQSFTYYADSHVFQVTDGKGYVTEFGYNGDGNLTSMTEAKGTALQRTTAWAYGYASWPNFWTTLTVPSTSTGSRTTTRAWNAGETQLTITEAGYSSGASKSYITTQTYGSKHRIATLDGPRTDFSDTTNFTYYADTLPAGDNTGRLYTSTDASGLQTIYAAYDVFGTAKNVTDPNNVLTTLTADEKGRVTGRTISPVAGDPDPNPYATTYRFDSRDRLDLVTYPNGNKTAYVYEDGTNRLTHTTRREAGGNERERLLYALNDIGGKIEEDAQVCSTPLPTCTTWTTNRSEKFTYDSKNRLTATKHPLPLPADSSMVVYTYDQGGLLASVQDERHASANTLYGYDALNRLSVITQTLAGAPGNQITTQYGYDVQDNLTSVSDPNGSQTTYVHDDFHRMTSQASPVSGATSYTYDEAGNLVDSTDANSAVAHRTYDAMNRLLTATSTRSGTPTEVVTNTWGGSGASARYAKGRLLSADVQVGGVSKVTSAYGYERRGLISSETQTVLGTAYPTGYIYDGNGNRTSITYPSGRVVNYTFDFADRPLTATSPSSSRTYVSTASYYPFGPENALTYGNGTVWTLTRNSRYQSTGLSLSGVSGVSYTYAPDALGNIIGITDNGNGVYNRTLGYDDLNRLTNATTGSGLWGATGSFVYGGTFNIGSTPTRDNLNRRQLLLGTRNVTYGYDAVASHWTTRLASESDVSPTAVSRDAAGNETSFGGASSSYSARNLLAAAGTTGYFYDARGVRAAETTPSPGTVMYTVTPCRVLDTRNPNGPYGGPALVAGGTRAFTIWGQCGIATNATAITLNVTVVGAGSDGYFKLFPSDVSQPAATAISFPAGRTRANNGIIKLSAAGQLSVYSGTTVDTHAILDVSGYFLPGPSFKKSFLYTPELHLLSETTSSMTTPSPATEYVWFGDRPVAVETVSDTNALRYVVTDQIGAPFLETDSNPAITWRVEYEPFGNVWGTPRAGSATDLRLRFPGQEQRDTSPSRYYNIFRWYRPDLGQYTQPDPVGIEGGLNLFAYALGNPLHNSDALGLLPATPTPIHTIPELTCDTPSSSARSGETRGSTVPTLIPLHSDKNCIYLLYTPRYGAVGSAAVAWVSRDRIRTCCKKDCILCPSDAHVTGFFKSMGVMTRLNVDCSGVSSGSE